MDTLIAELEKMRTQNNTKTVKIVDGLIVNTKEILKRIELYYNSKYETGDKNQLGFDKPFYNVVKFRVNIATVATDIDTKDFILISENPEKADRLWMYRHEVHTWMKESSFAKFLNDLGKSRPKYGSSFVKKTEDKDNLVIEVCNIHNLSFDPSEFSKHTAIFECHYMSPSELYDKVDAWDNIEDAISLQYSRGKASEYKKGDVKVIEFVGCVSGELVGEGEYEYPFYHIIYAPGGENGGVILFKEKLDTSIYKKLDWDSVPGRTLGVGVVEDGFEAQRWTNDAIQRQKALVDMSSKMLFHTDDDTLGNNVLVELENGDVIKTAEGKSFNQVNNIPSQLPVFDNHIAQWDKQLERATSTYNAFTGETMPSGTPYRAVATLQESARSMYQYKMEDLEIFLQDVFNDWVFPFLEKRLNRAHILSQDFSTDELKMIDDAFAKEEASKYALDLMTQDIFIDKDSFEAVYQEALQGIQRNGARRFIEVPKDYYKDMKSKVSLVITGENKNKGVVLESLSKVLADVSANPEIMSNPVTKKIYSRVLELADIGVSPAEIAQMEQQQVVESEQ